MRIETYLWGLQKRDIGKFKSVATDLIEEFYELCLHPLESERVKLEREERALKEAIELASKEQFVIQGRKNTLKQKIELLEEFSL